MSYGAVMEMVADWIGASKAYSGQWPTANSWPWLDSKVDMLCKKLHITTFVFVLYLLNKHNLVTPVVEEKYLSQLTQVVDINSWNRSKDKDVYLWLQNKYKGGQYV